MAVHIALGYPVVLYPAKRSLDFFLASRAAVMPMEDDGQLADETAARRCAAGPALRSAALVLSTAALACFVPAVRNRRFVSFPLLPLLLGREGREGVGFRELLWGFGFR